jgi:CO/xanthine dehydrogenase FAD-binding subunit
MATIGGNIASRYTWTEFNNCLLALEAKLQFILPNKKIATIPMDEFLSKNAKVGGILTSITIDLKRNTLATYQRLPKSSDVDVPLFTVCLKAEIDNRSLKDVRAVVYKGVSFPKREKRIEQALEGLTLGSTAQKELDHHRWQIEDGHLSEDKKMILAAMIKEAVLDLLAKAK